MQTEWASWFDRFRAARREMRQETENAREIKAVWCAQACFELAIAYCEIVEAAWAQLAVAFKSRFVFGAVFAWSVTWLPLTAWCWWRMLPLSTKLVRTLGYAKMSAEQCDARQRILRHHGRIVETAKCIHFGVKNCVDVPTYGRLKVAAADLVGCIGHQEASEELIQDAIMAAGASEVSEPADAIWIYRKCAELTNNPEVRTTCLAAAARLVDQAPNATDQTPTLNMHA